MAVTTTTGAMGILKAHAGTIQEVLDAVEINKGVNLENVIMFYNGSNITAILPVPTST